MRTFEEMLKDGFLDRIIYNDSGARHYKKDDNEAKNCDYELCKKCGGKCCRLCGCEFSPDDFSDLSFEGLLKEIEKGYITLELVDGDQFYIAGWIWHVRMRNADQPIVVMPGTPNNKKGCIALKEDGCVFDYKHRPASGRLLIPARDERYFHWECHTDYGTHEALREWKAHQKVLHDLAKFVGDKNYPCTI